MTQWEYCRVTWIVRKTTEREQQQIQPNGVGFVAHPSGMILAMLVRAEVLGSGEMVLAQMGHVDFFASGEEHRITELHSALTQLGRDEWELVSHTAVNTPIEQEVFYFKRVVVPRPSPRFLKSPIVLDRFG